MKKWLSLAAVLVLCLALVIGVACGEAEEEEEVKEVKFGASFPLSGVYGAVIGIPAKQAVELAAEKIGEFTVGGETYRWKLICEDNKFTSAGGVASATKLIYEDGVKFMHQCGADAGVAAQPLCEEAEVLMDTVGAPPEAFGPDKPHTFQISASFELCTPAFFRWLTTEHPEVTRIAIAQPDTGTGRAVGDTAIKAAEYFGLDIVAEEYYPAGTAEYYPLATGLMGKDPDLVLADTSVLTPMWEMGYEGLAGSIIWWNSMAVTPGWDNVQGYLCYMPQPVSEWPTDEVMEFTAEFQARNGEFTQGAFYAATILQVLTEALKKAGTVDDVDRVIQALQTETLDTWIGPVKFGGHEITGIDRWLMWPVPIAEVRGQELHQIGMIPPDEAWELAVEVYK